MPVATIDGGVLRYASTGDGEPLLLLLPQSTGPRGRQSLLDALALRHRVICYDQRGTGGSSAVPEALSMAQQAADAVGLLDALALPSVDLLCHSTGCGIGLSLAATFPQRVRSMVLVAPWTFADEHLSTMQQLRIDAARALAPQPYARFNSALLFPPEYRRAHAAGFAQQAASAPPQDADVIAGRLHAILAFDARALLPRIDCPTLAVSARDDQLMPAWFASEAAAGIPAGEVVILDGGGHMLLETRSDDIATLFHDFIDRRD